LHRMTGLLLPALPSPPFRLCPEATNSYKHSRALCLTCQLTCPVLTFGSLWWLDFSAFRVQHDHLIIQTTSELG
jgi:hypothetical protein